jgi:thiamine biosynthesis lipoprotein
VRLDTGGSTKGLLADLLARRLWDVDAVTIDLCGDVRVAGRASRTRPQEIEVVSPLTGAVAARLWLGDGAIATSGIDRRVWRTAGGDVAHHLLDPATGRPAWTGLAGATAVAATALEAETLAKTALLRGPDGGRQTLAAHGGILFCDDGRVEGIGALEEALA